MTEVEALKKVITGLKGKQITAGRDRKGWTAWGILSCKIADLELALLIREPKEKKESE